MGGFSVPGLSLSDLVGGAVRRMDEHRENDRKLERAQRQQHIQNLARLYEASNASWQRSWIAEEMARTDEADPEKPFKPRPLPMTPPTPKGGQAGAGMGQAGAGQGVGSQQGQPQPTKVGLRDLLPDITGEGTAQTGASSAPAGAGRAIGAGGSTGASAPAAAPAPAPAAYTPQFGPSGMSGLLPPSAEAITGPMSAAGIPAGTPKAVTPPGRSAPEASPMVGSLPGQPAPGATAAPQGPAMSLTPPMPQAAPQQPMTPDFPFLSDTDKRVADARAQFELEQEFGRTRGGKMLTPTPSPSDIQNAAGKGYKYTRDEQGQYSIEKMTPEELSLVASSRIAGSERRSKIDELRLELDRQKLDLSRQREGRLATQPLKGSMIDPKTRLQATLRTADSYRSTVKFYRDADRTLKQIESTAALANGPGDYAMILNLVHSIDDTAAREGEVATARSAASVANRMEQAVNKWTSGQLLDVEVRQQFVEAARALNSAIQQQRAEIDDQYKRIADEYALDPRQIGLPGGESRGAEAGEKRKAGSSSGSERLSRQERNRKTGATRTTYSDDGGKTWHP